MAERDVCRDACRHGLPCKSVGAFFFANSTSIVTIYAQAIMSEE